MPVYGIGIVNNSLSKLCQAKIDSIIDEKNANRLNRFAYYDKKNIKERDAENTCLYV